MRKQKEKMFINCQTGEIVITSSRAEAIRRFKADGKAHGYTVDRDAVKEYDGADGK